MTSAGRVLAVGVVAMCATLLPEAQESRIFTFRAGFWLHLHHFLYVLGRAENGTRDSSRRAVEGARGDESDGLARATPQEVEAWHAAVRAYAAGPSAQDAVFDEALWTVTGALAPLDETEPLTTVSLSPDVRRALDQAAPVYRRIWWPAHGRRSRAYIDGLQTMLRLEGPAILSIVSGAFGEAWPADGYPVNVSAYSNWAGAYSTGHRLLVISSLDPGLEGTNGLEILFHEASHQWDEALEARLQSAARRQGLARVPPGLSHALVFYTAGEAVHRVIPLHVPYAEANGMWASGPMARFKAPLDAHWGPYLRRGNGLDAALDALVAAAR